MGTAASSQSDAHALPRRRFTVEEVERMVEAGLLAEDEPIQLIEGELIVMSPQGPEHGGVLVELGERLREAYLGIGHVRSQLPLRTNSASLPEPDLAVVRGTPRHYFGEHPHGKDALLAVEVAVTSHAVDRAKARVYAGAGVPEYWIVDLASRQVEVHREPRAEGGYARVTMLGADAEISPPGAANVWRIVELLP